MYDQHLQFREIQTENNIRDIVIYARVSNRTQKDDLKNQIKKDEDIAKEFQNGN